ncbi:MAG: ABC transporter ATP-binding protein [Armatimonadetes bacterium]|nr:ABC transporter ATP-binding protein [Armatimonadota bacterium]
MNLNLEGVHRYYDLGTPAKVLDNVRLRVNSGGFISVMGPSGSGKTTLLNLIGCLDMPDFGKIFLEQTDVAAASETVREQIRLHHVGFVFQSYNLLPMLTVAENVLLPMQLAGVRKPEQAERCHSLLRLVALERRAHHPVTILSGGQKQRVAIARALANLPGLILADEPTGNLDGTATREVMDVLRSINENQNITTVLVTHDPMVAAYADELYYLENGQLSRSKAP